MRDIEKRVRCNLFDFIFIVAFFFCWRQNQLTNPHTDTQYLTPSAYANAYASVRRHLNTNTNTNMTQIDCAFCSRFNCSVAATAQTTIVTPTDDIQRLDSTTGTPSPPSSPSPSPSYFARLLLFSSLPFPATFEVPLQMCMTTVINFCLSFVFVPPALPTSLLPYSLPPCLPHRVLLRLWQAFVLWHRQPRQNVGRPCIVYTWDANSSFCYALEIFY